MKLLSIIVPAYNSQAFLDVGIPTMLHPDILTRLEIIIVNDGSTDQTANIAQSYCDRYPSVVRLISQENKGHGGALNTGFAAATGKYLKVVDSDDWVVTENLPALFHRLETAEADVILTHFHTVDISSGEIKEWKCYPDQFCKSYTLGEVLARWQDFCRCMTLHGIMYRTEFYRQAGIQLTEHVFYEDYEYATLPCCRAAHILPLDLFLYEYRIGDINQSVSAENQLKRLNHTETVLSRLIEESRQLTNDASLHYAANKTAELFTSFLTTSLMLEPNRAAGRQHAKSQISVLSQLSPEVYCRVKWKYRVFLLMNLLHIRKPLLDRILSSRIYRSIRNQHKF